MRPDVLLVNESPKRPLLWRRDCQKLVDRWDLRYVGGGRPAGSNMIACARMVELRDVVQLVLPQPRWQPRRGIVAAQLRFRGRLLGVVSCHLSLNSERRLQETRRVIEAVSALRGPIVLGDDLNEPPDGPCWRLMRAAGFVDHGTRQWRTFPFEDPDRRIDALLVRGDVRVLRHGDPGLDPGLLARASDHRPVLAELEL